MDKVHTGRCHCGAVAFRARGLADIWYCHCRQCRSLTGHFLAACRARREDVSISGQVQWTPVSDASSHGFCAVCCSPLFWSNKTSAFLSVLAGALDSTEGIAPRGHIFVSEKGSYYDLADGLPQFPRWPDDTGQVAQ